MSFEKYSLFFCSLFIALIGCKPKYNVIEEGDSDITKTETYQVLSTIASDEFSGRESGTVGYAKSAEYVESFLKQNGIKPLFNFNYKDTVFVKGDLSYNIVGVIGDNNPSKAHILLGAHLDHLGVKPKSKDKVYNGADDNASGVTAVLQLAKALQEQHFDKNIIIALFTGEEKGLIGSTHLAKRLKREGYSLEYMLNFEMIGTKFFGEKNTVFLTGNTLSNCAFEMNKVVGKAFVKPFEMEEKLQLYYRSDNVAFYDAFKVPCHTISSYDFKSHAHYHELNDEIDQLDVENMQSIINSSLRIITTFLNEDVQLKMK